MTVPWDDVEVAMQTGELDGVCWCSKEICWQIGRPITQCGNELRGFEERSRHMVEIAKESLQNIPATKNDEFDNFISKDDHFITEPKNLIL